MNLAVEVETFTQDYVEDTVSRLRMLRPDARPKWGAMNASSLVPHLICTLKYSMGRRGELPYTGTWVTRRVVAPLVLRGLLPLTGSQIPDDCGDGRQPPEHGDLESFHALLEEYLLEVQIGALEPKPHPTFGDIGIDGWARFHVRHIEHHLKQFGL